MLDHEPDWERLLVVLRPLLGYETMFSIGFAWLILLYFDLLKSISRRSIPISDASIQRRLDGQPSLI